MTSTWLVNLGYGELIIKGQVPQKQGIQLPYELLNTNGQMSESLIKYWWQGFFQDSNSIALACCR